jgi:hypothetical protein
MPETSFITYIDESGDEGFVFNPDGSGSSRWFVLSALVVRKQNDLELVKCLKEVRAVLRKPPVTPLHFVELKHEQRIPYVRRIALLPVRTVSVLIYKPAISEPEKFQNNKYLLYRYGTRLLLERVSWLCRDHRMKNEDDASTTIIFSNRSHMSYDAIRDYLRLLLSQNALSPDSVQLDGSVIRPEDIQTVQHSQLAGLQAVDAVASSVHFAVKVNRYEETEPSYFNLLKRTCYRHESKLLGYGIKLWPGDNSTLKTQAPEVVIFEGL